MTDRPIIIGTGALAAEFGVDRRTISNWRAQGMPQVARGKWDLGLCKSWVAEFRDDQLIEATASAEELRAAKLRVYTAQAERHEVLNARLFAELVHVEVVQAVHAQCIAEQISAGDNWVAQARNAEEKEQRRALWFNLRDRIAESSETLSRALAAGEDVAPTRLRNGRSMG